MDAKKKRKEHVDAEKAIGKISGTPGMHHDVQANTFVKGTFLRFPEPLDSRIINGLNGIW
jgi:hypothetical protein